MTNADEETELDLTPYILKAHESRAGFKGGQGRTGEEVERETVGAGTYLAMLAGAAVVLGVLHWLGIF
jgi:hypothetical protein